MALGTSNWFLIIYLVFLTSSFCNGAMEMIHKHGNHVHSHHMGGSTLGFFTLKDLFSGEKMAIPFPNYQNNPQSSPPFINKEKADSIPFSLKQLPNLLKYFSISQASPQAKAMEETLGNCESKPIRGETKTCVTSLESMLDFVSGILGLDTPIEFLNTQLPNSPNLFQNYTFLEEPKEVPFRKTVACHKMSYPYAVFYCHSSTSVSKVFKVSLGGDDGMRLENAVVVCHIDTSAWDSNHVSFRVLGLKPGTSTPVCHFFVGYDFLWVSAPAASTTTG